MDKVFLVCYLFKVFNNYLESYKFKGIKFQLCKYKQIFVGLVWFYCIKYNNFGFDKWNRGMGGERNSINLLVQIQLNYRRLMDVEYTWILWQGKIVVHLGIVICPCHLLDRSFILLDWKGWGKVVNGSNIYFSQLQASPY